MSLRSLAVLACRILAIVALINAIQAGAFLLPLFYEAFHPTRGGMESPIGYFPLEPWLALIYLSPLALLLIFAGFLWTRADGVAVKMIGERDETGPIAVDQNSHSLAFSVLGAYVLTVALPRLAQLLVHAWNVSSQDATFHRDWTGFAPNLVYTIVEIALGLWLLFGARGLVTLLFALRNIGRDAEPQREENGDAEFPLRPEN